MGTIMYQRGFGLYEPALRLLSQKVWKWGGTVKKNDYLLQMM